MKYKHKIVNKSWYNKVYASKYTKIKNNKKNNSTYRKRIHPKKSPAKKFPAIKSQKVTWCAKKSRAKKSPAKKFPAIKSPKVTAWANKFPAKKSLIVKHCVCFKWAKTCFFLLFISMFSKNAWIYLSSTTTCIETCSYQTLAYRLHSQSDEIDLRIGCGHMNSN